MLVSENHNIFEFIQQTTAQQNMSTIQITYGEAEGEKMNPKRVVRDDI